MNAAGKLKIFCGSANPILTDEICDHLGLPNSPIEIKSFSDGEIFVEIGESVRGDDVFIIQPTCAPVNDNLMKLCIALDTYQRASAGRITAVIPYFGYARQDQKKKPRVPISAKVVAEMIQNAGANRVLLLDLHANQIQGFFDAKKTKVDHLYAMPVFLKFLANYRQDDIVMVSPDAGGVERARAYAKRLDVGIAIIDKRRERANVAQAMHVIGDVTGKIAIIFDDMVDTAGTLCSGVDILLEKGAKEVYAICTHGVLSGRALERIQNSNIKSMVVTNSIPQDKNITSCRKIKVLSVASLIGDAINRIHNGDSVDDLFA